MGSAESTVCEEPMASVTVLTNLSVRELTSLVAAEAPVIAENVRTGLPRKPRRSQSPVIGYFLDASVVHPLADRAG